MSNTLLTENVTTPRIQLGVHAYCLIGLNMTKSSPVEIGQRIKEVREKRGLRQKKLAQLLGMSRSTVSQIESGKRKVSAEELRAVAEILNVSVTSLLNSKGGPEVVLEFNTKKEKRQPQVRINVPQRNVEKFKEVLLYILNKVGSKPNVGETVLYKLLYFADFDYYEKFEEQLIGATYQKNHYGPTPMEFEKIVRDMEAKGEIIRVQSDYFSFPQTKYLPLRKPDLTKLKASEIEVIDSVLNRLSDMNATQISDYSHKDVPWLTTEDGGVIEYESVFYRTAPYSVREYE